MRRSEAFHLSRLIEQCSGALAEWTLELLCEVDPGAAEMFADRDRWTRALVTRFRYLAQAIAVDEPGVFAEAIEWARGAAVARDEPASYLDTSLAAMSEIVAEEFPEVAASKAAEMIERARTSDTPQPPESGVSSLGIATLEFLEALLEHDRSRAQRVCLNALENGMTVEDVYTTILQPAQIEIGSMWHRDEISVAAEHAATAITEAVMAVLRERIMPEYCGRTMVATAVGGELHAVGLRMVADFFEFAGWRVMYLGANVPHVDVASSLADQEADLLAISCTSTLHLRSVGELVALVRDRNAAAHILVGGRPFRKFPNLWTMLGADGWAADAAGAVAEGNRLAERK